MTDCGSNQNLFIPKVAIIGLGLIGCSWVKGLRAAEVVGQVQGFDRNLDSMQEAKKTGSD